MLDEPSAGPRTKNAVRLFDFSSNARVKPRKIVKQPTTDELDTQVLTVTFDVYVAGEKEQAHAQTLECINAVRQYRAAVSKLAGIVFLAEMAGATIEDDGEYLCVKPNSERARTILTAAGGHSGKAHLYELYPVAKQFLDGLGADIACAALRQVSSWWRSRDRVHKDASIGYMVLQGVRTPARFAFAPLPMPSPNGDRYRCRIEGHSFFLSIYTGRKKIECKLTGRGGRCDSSRYWIFKKIRDGALKAGQCGLRLTKDSKLKLDVTYHRPLSKPLRDSDINRAVEVAFSTQPEQFIQCRLLKGHRPTAGMPVDDVLGHSISAVGALSDSDRKRMQMQRYDLERRAAGNPNSVGLKEGCRKAYKAALARVNRISLSRGNCVRTWNHRWSREIVATALRWECGTITVFGPPSAIDPKVPKLEHGLLGRPWQWSDFILKLQYKAAERGIQVKQVGKVTAEQIMSSI